MEWTDIRLTVSKADAEAAEAVATMIAEGGIYIEDYSDIEEQVEQIAHVDLIEQELLDKPRDTVIIHMYLEPGASPVETLALIAARMEAAGIPYTSETEGVEQEDWQNGWRKYYHPLEIGKRLAVVPSWQEYDTDRVKLVLDPGLAFGTGGHETTSLCMEALDERVQGGERVLDIGTGSGILAIAALKLGAAVAEGVELVTLQAPVRTETDANGHAIALWTQPQIIGEMDKKGRPAPEKAKRSEKRIAADVVVVAIGQGVETHGFEQTKIAIKRGAFVAEASGQIDNMDGVFAGGDCVTGPATVIRAIAAGKVAAANIDEYLGFHHEIDPGVEIPTARLNNKPPHGRIDTTEREAGERKHDFKCIECGLTDEEAYSEASRCLRCDHFGYGIFRGGRKGKW